MTLQASVARWNARYKQNDPPEDCPRCGQPRLIEVTAHGTTTTAHCDVCAFTWIIK